MKKSKFITGLSAAFVATMALMSCSSLIRGKDGVVLTINGVEYTAQDLFGDQKTPAAEEAKFNAVFKVAVRAYFKKNTDDEKEIEKETQIKISEQKATAQSNADKNGTSYNEEWEKILDSNGVEDEQGLYNKFEYEIQKEKFESKLYDNNYDTLRNGGQFHNEKGEKFGEEVPGYLANKMPYHIKHILVKIAGAKGGDGVNAEITADEAKKLSGVIKKLAEGRDFADVSKDFNDDATAKENGGSLGIMSRDTSFVNDFKLGIYLYESYFSKGTKSTAKDKLFPDGDVSGAGSWAKEISALKEPSTDDGSGADRGIGQIPYEVAERLEEYADLAFDDSSDSRVKARFESAGLSKEDVAAKYYPRNVIFNKYFNKHNIMVITPKKMHDYKAATGTGISGTITDWVNSDLTQRNNKTDSYLGYTDTKEGGYKTLEGFTRSAKNDDTLEFNLPDEPGSAASASNTVLRDENGRTILVFRSGTGDSSNDAYQGIHFVVIERSPFIDEETDFVKDGTAYKTNINEYYTEYYPNQSTGDVNKHHPVYGDYDPSKKDNDWKHTFVYYFRDTSLQNLKSRADTVKDELKKCTDKLDTYIYDYLLKAGDIKFNEDPNVPVAKEIEKSIANWIKLTRNSKKMDDKNTWNDTWQEYCYSLLAQTEQRKEEVAGGTVYSRLIPEACAIAFADFDNKFATLDNLSKLFGKGGVFHD